MIVLQYAMKRIFLTMLLLAPLLSCAPRQLPVTNPRDALAPISWWSAPAPGDDMAFKDAAVAARQSLEYYKKLPPDVFFYFGQDRITALDMAVTLQNFLLIIENDSFSYEKKTEQIKNNFALYKSVGSDGRGKMLFTGYYEPVISCRLKPDESFRYPLYRKPDDIVEIDLTLFGTGFPQNKLLGRLENKKVVPYFSREEIDQKKALSGKNLEILWCADMVDIFVLQVQGSGKADLGDGTMVSVLYGGQNGRPYKSVGRYLIDSGIISKENMSMQAIRGYLHAHPDELGSILGQNPSYVFFRVDSGPSHGSIAVPLTPGRSIATDSRLLPKGALGFMVSEKPIVENGAITSWTPFTRFVLNQDTGGAIKGPGRADLFWGLGSEAELGAGHMKHEGELYFLIRKK
jgi:membrane-bound lytic murein transglycosylase A